MACSDTLRILNIQRMSTEDGPGLRTTVFFKGCPLHCGWCHNPESIAYDIEKEWIQSSCIHCLSCVQNCPEAALTVVNDTICLDRNKCVLCQKCIDVCPTGAMKILGIDKNVDWLFHELIKDKAYFGSSGGVTFSGGEVLMQAKNAVKLAQKLFDEGIHVALDTSGFAEYRNLMELLPYIDLVLYDLKHIDSVRHQALTGVDNHLILENLIRLNQTGIRIWIRTPIIPDATDTLANIEGIAHFLKEYDIRYERWELCAFNNLCIDKYKRLGKDWTYEKRLLMDKASMDRLTQIANDIIKDCIRPVIWTGMTRLEEKKDES